MSEGRKVTQISINDVVYEVCDNVTNRQLVDFVENCNKKNGFLKLDDSAKIEQKFFPKNILKFKNVLSLDSNVFPNIEDLSPGDYFICMESSTTKKKQFEEDGDYFYNNDWAVLTQSSTSKQWIRLPMSGIDMETAKVLADEGNNLITKGDVTKPIYFKDGKPKLLSSELGIGSGTKFIYLSSDGSLTASNSNVGSNEKPVYLKDGTITESAGNVGNNTQPVYLKDGNMTPFSDNIGNITNPVYISKGVIKECTTKSMEVGKANTAVTCTGNSATSSKLLDSGDERQLTFSYQKDGLDNNTCDYLWATNKNNTNEQRVIHKNNITVGSATTANHIPTSKPDSIAGAIWVS